MIGDQKFASLVLLSYKRPEFLKKTLESLWASTNYWYELIVVDDGSHDKSLPYLLDLVKQKKVSTVIFNAGGNMGVGVGMNRGFQVAHGDYLVKLDSDLTFEPGWLSEGVGILDRFPQIWIVGWFHYWHEPCRANKKYKETLTLDDDPLEVEVHEQFVSSAMMFKKETYDEYGPMAEGSSGYAEDVFFKKKITEAGGLLGLTTRDLIHNYGFGIPHSTVVLEGMKVRPLHLSPLIFTANNAILPLSQAKNR